MEELPIFFDAFVQPIRDNPAAQVAMVAALILIALDVLLGFCAAVKNHEVASGRLREGAWHKCGEMGVMAIGDVMDGCLVGGLDLGFTAPVFTSLCVYLIVNEAISCLENCVKLNPNFKRMPLIGTLAKKLAVLEGEEKESEDGQ